MVRPLDGLDIVYYDDIPTCVLHRTDITTPHGRRDTAEVLDRQSV